MLKYRVLFVMIFACMSTFAVGIRAESPPSAPPPQPPPAKEFASAEKAWRLFELAREENGKLRWDECLAKRAIRRARNLVEEGYFEHRDPWTGENDAWRLVSTCHECRFAGENLTKGYQSAEDTHDALMESPEHRKNILDRTFQYLGVGCHDYICVQLFAGY